MEANIEIRRVSPDQIDMLMDWRIAVIQEVFGVTKEEAMTLYDGNRAYYEKNLPTKNHVACFAYIDGELAGGGGICFSEELPSPDNPSGKVGYLMSGMTLPKFRHHGVIKEVAEWLINTALERGVTKITMEASEMGKDLYRTFGFVDFKNYMIYKKEG